MGLSHPLEEITMNNTRSIVILGANGRLGSAACIAFAQAGWRVLAQVRRPGLHTWPTGVEELNLPIEAPEAWTAVLPQAHWVLHASNPVYTRWRQEALPLVEQSLALAQALGARWVLPGNVYNYGAKLPERIDAHTPFAPDHDKARIRVAMEELAQAHSERGLPVSIVRAGDFYGHGQGTWLDLVVAKRWRQARLTYPGPLDKAHAWAYLPDYAQTLVALAQRPQPLPDFEALRFGGHTLNGAQLLAAIQQAADELMPGRTRAWRTERMPWWLLRLGSGLVPMWREVLAMRYLWTSPHEIVSSEWPQAGGSEPPSTPVAQAMTQALRSF
jgi:nucleoside-diphosphate-sugar epimerase